MWHWKFVLWPTKIHDGIGTTTKLLRTSGLGLFLLLCQVPKEIAPKQSASIRHWNGINSMVVRCMGSLFHSQNGRLTANGNTNKKNKSVVSFGVRILCFRSAAEIISECWTDTFWAKTQHFCGGDYGGIPGVSFLSMDSRELFSQSCTGTFLHTGTFRLIQIWIIRIPGQFKVLWKSHSYLSVLICLLNSKFA